MIDRELNGDDWHYFATKELEQNIEDFLKFLTIKTEGNENRQRIKANNTE